MNNTPMDQSASLNGEGEGFESEIGRVLDRYLAEIEAGRRVDAERLLAEHPAIADRLRACLAVFQVADAAAEVLGASEESDRTYSLNRTVPRPPSEDHQPVLGAQLGQSSRLLLRDLPDDGDAPVLKRTEAMSSLLADRQSRYQLMGEIARGGMGAVLKGRDTDLGRDLAIKVQLEAHKGDPEMLRRFVEEAQIGGQLQHPGIVPVYELGTFADKRAFFAMKLVQGRTLATLLRQRPDPTVDLPRFLGIFDQVCQTMAYAHARGVIHRDLKPSNVMVGSFGEVQVMDWGLAKVISEDGAADDEAATLSQRDIGSQDAAEWFVGIGFDCGIGLGHACVHVSRATRGEIDSLDERADVFGLGAILCEILTGAPPHLGSTPAEVREKAKLGDISEAFGRLDSCGADQDLLVLTRACLSARAEERPRDAREVSLRITTYLTGVQERLRAADLARVEAQAKALEERKRRKVSMALAASIVGFVVVIGGISTLSYREQLRRTARVSSLAGEAELLTKQARADAGDPAKWMAALEAVKRAEVALEGVSDRAARQAVIMLRNEADRGLQDAEVDRKLVARLISIRTENVSWENLEVPRAIDAAYSDAFASVDINIDALGPKEAGARIARRRPEVVQTLVAALDHWCDVSRQYGSVRADWPRLLATARFVDLDPDRDALRSTRDQREDIACGAASTIGGTCRCRVVVRCEPSVAKPSPGRFQRNLDCCFTPPPRPHESPERCLGSSHVR